VLLDSSGRIVVGITDGDIGGTSVARILTAGPTVNQPVPLAGTVIGTTGSFRNQGMWRPGHSMAISPLSSTRRRPMEIGWD